MPTVDVHGIPVHYTARGEGPGLLLVHGTGGDGDSNWAHLRGHFTARHTVITPDYSDSGRTPPHRGGLNVDELAEQVVGAARAVTGAPFDVVGFSLGAVVAVVAAAAHPERVRRLVVVNGWARRDDPRQRLLFDLWPRLVDAGPDVFAAYTTLAIHSPSFLAGLGEDGVREAVSGIVPGPGALRQIALDARVDITDRLPRVRARTLVIGSRQDQLIPVGHSREIHRAVAGSEYAELDCGHMVTVEKPTELVALIQGFLDRD
ncbi:alpha/beta fold hydrolase [Streptomyces sp. JNUCC 64]